MQILPQRNVDRAARIDRLRIHYEEGLGERPDSITTYLHLASMLADMRHWCDVNREDFQEAVKISEQHHAQEQGEEEVLSVMKNLAFVSETLVHLQGHTHLLADADRARAMIAVLEGDA